jgi:hypothetical protein
MRPTRLAVSLAVAAVLTFGLGGCLERRMTILSNPEGALVYLNGHETGTRTPTTVAFDWYGTYEIELRYERTEAGPDGRPVRKFYYLKTAEKVSAPPQEWIGFDFFADVLPFKFTDHKTFTYVIPQRPNPSDTEMVERAMEGRGLLDRPADIRRPE